MVIVGQSHHQVGSLDICFDQQLLVELSPVEHHRPAQLVHDFDQPFQADLDDLNLRVALALLDSARDIKPDIVAVSDEGAGGFLLVVSKYAKRAVDLVLFRHDIGKVARHQLVC